MANISKIKVPNDSTTYDVRDTAAVTSLKTVNSTSLEGSGNITVSESRKVWYGTCSTASSTATKEVVTTTGNFVFTDGNILKVKFSNGSTATTPKLKVTGSTNTYNIKINTANPAVNMHWQAKEVIDFVYYSGAFYITHNPMSSGSTSTVYPSFGSTKLSDVYSSNDASTSTIPTARAISNVNTAIGDKMIEFINHDYTLTPNSSYFQLYDSTKSINLRVWDEIVDLTGAVKPTKTITGSATEYTICTIPEEYRPEIGLVEPMQGSNQGIWMCRVHGANDGDDGAVTFSRFRSANAWQDVSTSTWLPFHMIWVNPHYL